MKKSFLLIFCLLGISTQLSSMEVFGFQVDIYKLVEKGYYQDIVRYLCSGKCDIGRQVNYCKVLKDGFKLNVLHLAAENGDLDIVKLLVKHGADINVVDSDGNTPLALTAFKGWLEIVHFLIENGADVNIKNDNGDTALHMVARGYGGYEDIFWYQTFNVLADKIRNVDARNKDEETPLHIVAEWGFLDGVKTLIKRGANIKLKDAYGYTPLHCACFFLAPLEVIVYLIEHGGISVLNEKSDNYHKYTSIVLAFWRDLPSFDIITYLAVKGAKVSDDDSKKHICGLSYDCKESFDDEKFYLKTLCKLGFAKNKNKYIFKKLSKKEKKHKPFLEFLFCDAIQKVLHSDDFSTKKTLLYNVYQLIYDSNIDIQDKNVIKNKIAKITGVQSNNLHIKKPFDRFFCFLLKKMGNRKSSSRFLKDADKASRKLCPLSFKLNLYDSLRNKKSKKDVKFKFKA